MDEKFRENQVEFDSIGNYKATYNNDYNLIPYNLEHTDDVN